MAASADVPSGDAEGALDFVLDAIRRAPSDAAPEPGEANVLAKLSYESLDDRMWGGALPWHNRNYYYHNRRGRQA